METPEIRANREHKNSLFTFMFGTFKEWLLELYNAFAGTNITDTSLVEIVTLQGILFLNQMNDIAFTIGDTLVVLIEHQSTVNENLPLRLLMYVARIYEKLIDKDAIYRRRLIKLPKPQFIVLYNGKDEYPDHKTLRLSDAFRELPPELQSTFASGSLELEVDVYNINKGHNEDVLARSEHLSGYVTFESVVRNEYDRNGGDLAAAFQTALKYCEDNGILPDFLPKHSSEVENMLTTEFDIDRAGVIWREEAFQEGIERGIERGMARGLERGLERGMERGIFETAQRLLSIGVPLEQVAKATLLSLEVLHKLTQGEEFDE